MKRIAACALCLAFLCTACAEQAEQTDSLVELATAPAFAENLNETAAPETTEALTEPETLPTPPMPSQPAETDETAETEPPTEPPADWQIAYRTLLADVYAASSHEASYFALIALNGDETPELVVLDDTEMQLYCYNGTETVLLLEDGYKDTACSEQNVCFQPLSGRIASAFSTMGAGSGFYIFAYADMNTVDVTRYKFDNNADEGGELPYDPVWDRAAEFGVVNNGYHDVTLDDTWTHIGADFPQCWELTKETAAAAGEGWSLALVTGAGLETEETE